MAACYQALIGQSVQERPHDFFWLTFPSGHGINDLGNVIDMARRSEDAKLRRKGAWTHQKGSFYHDGRFATVRDFIEHYERFFRLSFSEAEKRDLAAYLLSL
jgi:hypothetical protein